MKNLIDILISGCHALVVRDATGREHAYDSRGVSDLHRLLKTRPALLRGAEVADKVVGMGAAVLMIEGRVEKVHALVVSDDALRLLREAEIIVTYGIRVPQIINNNRTGRCPLEARLAPISDIKDMMPEIDDFVGHLPVSCL